MRKSNDKRQQILELINKYIKSMIEDILKRFRERFVEPMDKKIRAMTLNNEPCILGKAKDAEDFLHQKITAL